LGRLKLKALAGICLFCLGYGIALHAIASELYQKGGYSEVISFQGEWIGMFLTMVGFILLLREYLMSDKYES
jgi:hypothetical protein